VPGLAVAEQIVQISEVNTQANVFTITDNGTGTGGSETLTVTSAEIYFSYSTDLLTGIPQNELAYFSMTATTTTSATEDPYGDITAPGFSGSFSITDAASGQNLLSGTFASSGHISGTSGGDEMTFADSDTTQRPNEVTYTSAYLNFSGVTTEAFSFSMSNVTPALALDANDQFLEGTTAAGTATFSATPPPIVVAEPGTLVLAGGALLGIGLIVRRRRLRAF
jgi:hypothetical protein